MPTERRVSYSLRTATLALSTRSLLSNDCRPDSPLTVNVSWDLMTHFGCMLFTLVTYGPDFLSKKELEGCVDRLLDEYYNFLAVSFMRGRRDKKFWEYQKKKLDDMVGFSRTRLARAILTRFCKAVLNPYETIEKLCRHRISAVEVESENVERSRLPVHANGIVE